MKKTIFALALITLFISCGSYNSIDGFYEAHKNDTNVTAVQVPRFMLSTLSNLLPEMNSFIGNIRDLRYIQLSPKNDAESQRITSQLNNITSSSFIDVFRKNEDTKRTLISLRERKDVVKEIIIYSSNPTKKSVLYLNGNFNPAKVRQYANEQKFDSLINKLTQQYKWNTPSTSSISN